jgi:hypothetical protein
LKPSNFLAVQHERGPRKQKSKLYHVKPASDSLKSSLQISSLNKHEATEGSKNSFQESNLNSSFSTIDCSTRNNSPNIPKLESKNNQDDNICFDSSTSRSHLQNYLLPLNMMAFLNMHDQYLPNGRLNNSDVINQITASLKNIYTVVSTA